MAKISYDTAKFYPGYPVFIAITKDISGELIATTYSSSYTLQDVFVMGATKDSNTAQNLKVGQELSLNFLSGNEGLLSDIGGMSRRVRMTEFQKAGARFKEVGGVPTLENAPLTMLGKVNQIVEDEWYYHIFIRISQRLLDERLLSGGKVDWEKFTQLEYMGDAKRRHYKVLPAEFKNDGDFLKESRKKHENRR